MFPARPHVEIRDKCASCDAEYCSKCENRCPKCYSIHIQYRGSRKEPWYPGSPKRKEMMSDV